MTLLIKLLGSILILLAIIISILAGIYIVHIELYELFEVDVLHKVKNKIRRLCYGEKRSTKVVEELFRRRTIGYLPNRRKLSSIKRRIREKTYNQKTISKSSGKASKKGWWIGG